MGCILSTETQDRSNEPEQGKDVQSMPGHNGITQIISSSIPSIPGWDRIPTDVISVQVTFEMKRTWRDEPVSMEPLVNAIKAQNTAGLGYSLAAIFLPVIAQGRSVERGKAMELEWKGCCGGTIEAKAMCIFQKKSDAKMVPVETVILRSTMRQKYKPFSMDTNEVEGYEKIYSQLSQAGKKQKEICIVDIRA